MRKKNDPALPAKDQSERDLADRDLRNRMDQIDRKLLVLSGKDGVGKSTVAANLATALARADKTVGLRFLGSIPIDPEIVDCGDSGKPFAAEEATSPTAQAFARAVQPILAGDNNPETREDESGGAERRAI